MKTIHLLLPGPAHAPYPNGGDEAYWMGQVAGALASHLHQAGVELSWAPPQEDCLCLALCSQMSPPSQEGQQKGPQVLWRPGDVLGAQAAGAILGELAQVYPQPGYLTREELDALPELEGVTGPGVAVRLLYRDNPQDEAWLAASAGEVGRALAEALARV